MCINFIFSTYSWAKIVPTDTKALSNDQILSNELTVTIEQTQERDRRNQTKTIFQSSRIYTEVFTPIDNISLKSSCNMNKTSGKAEEYNE